MDRPTDRPTDGQRGCRVACMRLKTYMLGKNFIIRIRFKRKKSQRNSKVTILKRPEFVIQWIGSFEGLSKGLRFYFPVLRFISNISHSKVHLFFSVV